MRCCRQDGLILKPSQPLTMIDLLISDWAINKGITQGELYSTKTIMNFFILIPSMIGSSSGIILPFIIHIKYLLLIKIILFKYQMKNVMIHQGAEIMH
jgi:hypothetical protein